jgi:hypothetical protein
MASMGNAQRGALGGLAKLGEGPRTTSDLSRVGGGLSRGANEGKKLNAAPWSDTFPAAGATLDLDFANNRGFVRGVGQGGVMDAITFTRASNGTFVKPDGTLSTHANQGALGNNLLSFPQDFDNAVWQKLQISLDSKVAIAPNETVSASKIYEDTANQQHRLAFNFTIVASTRYTLSFYIKDINRQFVTAVITGNISNYVSATFDLTNETVTQSSALGTGYAHVSSSVFHAVDGWYRIVLTGDVGTNVSSATFLLGLATNGTPSLTTRGLEQYTGDGESGIFIWGAQLELGSTATEYFPTNIGEPRFDWASTDSTGAGTIADPRVIPLRANPTSNGILIEEARTNRLLWNRDATQTEWVKTNITAAKDQTGIDGVANAASSLTATDDNGTCIQTITLGAGNRTGSVYLKRLTGTGNIQVTLDGSTYSTVELSDTEWYRIVLSGSVTNPTVGIKIAVDGDAVAMDYGQVEDGLGVSTPILTTDSTATRAAEVNVLFNELIFDNNKMTIYAEAQQVFENGGTSGAEVVGFATSNNSVFTRLINLDQRINVGFLRPEANVSQYQQAPTEVFKVATTYTNLNYSSPSNRMAAIDGVLYNAGITSVGGNNQTFDRASFGMTFRSNTTQNWLNGTIKRVVIFPKSYTSDAVLELTL